MSWNNFVPLKAETMMSRCHYRICSNYDVSAKVKDLRFSILPIDQDRIKSVQL